MQNREEKAIQLTVFGDMIVRGSRVPAEEIKVQYRRRYYTAISKPDQRLLPPVVAIIWCHQRFPGKKSGRKFVLDNDVVCATWLIVKAIKIET